MIRKPWPVAALATVALIGAGCSNGSAENGNAGNSNSGGNESAANTGNGNSSGNENTTNRGGKAVRFSECMRDHGVSKFPGPDASGELTIDGIVNGSSLDPSTPAWKEAISACKDLQPPGFTGHRRSTEQQEAALRFAQCMRDNGVKDFPDPTEDAPLIDTTRIPSAAGRGALSIPGFTAAQEQCSDLARDAMGGR